MDTNEPQRSRAFDDSTVTVAQLVQSVRGNYPISISDKPDDDLGEGETIGDIAIGADCRSV